MIEDQIRHVTLGDRIKRMESRFFVGREQEKTLFLNFLTQQHDRERILNIYGIGGIGKSFLLDEYRRLAENLQIPFLQLDTTDFTCTPQGLCAKLLLLLNEPISEKDHHPIENCLNLLNTMAEKKRLVIAIDTYEEIGELEWWLREKFMSQMADNILFILSGRHVLKGSWIASPAWRSLIISQPLAPFDLASCKAYAERYDIHSDSMLRTLYAFTQGHPLTLSLSIGLSLEDLPPEQRFTRQEDLFRELAYRWLREVPDESLRALVEAATLVRSFDQELLEWMLGFPMESTLFRKLINLSFIRPCQGGYYIHALLRTTLSREIRSRTPKRYNHLWQRSITYYHQEIVSPSSEHDLIDIIADLMYGLGDSILLSTFFEAIPDDGYEYETVYEGNLHLVEEYIEDVLQANANYVRNYFDLQSGEAHSMEISAEHDRSAFSHLDPAKLITLGTDVIRMIKNAEGITIGLAVFIPIHRDSLDYLKELPISKHYFATLTHEQLEQYRSDPDQPAGWYIYHIDLRKDGAIPSRTALMHLLLSLLMKRGTLLFSSPLPYHQEITKRMGFHQVVGATHFDFGPNLPSPTYLLDLRGEKQRKYFDLLLQQVGVSLAPSLPEGIFNFTSKEREVALLVMSTQSIAEIAESLNVTEAAIKKHLGRIYKKAEVRGKIQLLKKLMEAVSIR